MILTASFLVPCRKGPRDRNFSRNFSMWNWEKIIISPWMGRVGLLMGAYIIIPIIPSPCCPMPTSCPEAIFGKIAPISVKNRFWPDWDSTSRYSSFQIVGYRIFSVFGNLLWSRYCTFWGLAFYKCKISQIRKIDTSGDPYWPQRLPPHRIVISASILMVTRAHIAHM